MFAERSLAPNASTASRSSARDDARRVSPSALTTPS
jgi:hypothetical protein